MKFYCGLLLIGSLLLMQPATAGVWPQGEGNGYFNLSFTYLRYHEVINGSLFQENGFNITKLNRTVQDHTLNGYLEYGLSDRLTVIANVPYKIQRTEDALESTPTSRFAVDTLPAGSLNALGNVRLGGRYLLHKGKGLWAVQLVGGFNTATFEQANGLRTGYDAWYVTPRIQWGKSWGKTYVSTSLGYRYKSNGYAHDLISDNEFGYCWTRSSGKPTWFILTFGANLAVTNGVYDDQTARQTGLYQDEEGFVDPGLKINHYFTEHLALNVSAIGAIWAWKGGNQLTYTAGVAYDW